MLGLGISLINVLIFGGIFGVMGASLLVYGWNLNRQRKVAPGWPSVKGKVTSSQVDRTSVSTGRIGFSPVVFVPVIQYSYQVNDLAYQRDNLASGKADAYNSVTAQNVVDRYRPGKVVTVYYNPSNPGEALVDLDPRKGDFYVRAGVGVLALTILFSCGVMGFSALVSGGIQSLMH